jgi:hypothetical protein
MAENEDQQVEDALDKLVSINDKRGNLRTDMRQDILESVSTLKKLFAKMKTQLEYKSEENKKLREEVMKIMEETERTRGQPTRQVTPSLDHRQHTYSGEARLVPRSEVRRRKFFSEVVKDEGSKRYRINTKAKDNSQSMEQIKNQLKDINPSEIKVGIKTLITLRDGRILIGTSSEEEINSLSREISIKCGEELEIMKHKLRKPRLIIYNVPEEKMIGNVTSVIKAQNPEITLNGEDITAKFRYKPG